MKNVIEIRRTDKDNIEPDSNILFNAVSPYSQGITYDPATREIILSEAGLYSVKWWVATEASLTGCIEFVLKSSQGDLFTSCSPTKRGQLVGFANIDALSAGVTLSLVNNGSCQVILSQNTPVTAYLLAVRIPEDGIIPTFGVDKVETLEPGEDATADVLEDEENPNNWLFSFGIPKGETGLQGDTPHIDTDTGNWFVGETDTGVQARGPTGPPGPPSLIIPFSISKYGVYLSHDAQGEPVMVAFSGFGSSYSDMSTYLQEGEWATGTFTIREDMYSGAAFIMPHNSTVKKIKLLFATGDSYAEALNMIHPFVALAVSNSDNFVYNILQDSITFTEPYEGGIQYPKNVIRKGASDNLGIDITEGSLVAIVVGITGENATSEQQQRFTVSGGIYME